MQPPIDSEHRLPEKLSVRKIIIRQSAFDAEDPAQTVEANVNFVNALFNAHYLRDELPVNALRSYHVDYYLAQACNGGHGQFVRNSNWLQPAIEDISEGLRAMQADAYIEIFGELRRLIEGDAERARAIAEGGGFGKLDPAIEELDKRFFESKPRETLTPANARWLKDLPELHAVPDDQHVAAMSALRTANPFKDERAAQSQQQALGFALTDPLKVASKLLCAKAGCLPVTGYGAGDPALAAPDGRTGIAWGVQAAGSQFVMYLFEDVALLCEHFLADGRKVTNELLARTGQQLLAGSLENLASWSHSTTREIARVPRTDVNDAIEAAKTFPVQEAAQKLLAKLNSGESVKEIFALKKDRAGRWIWQVATDHRTAHLHVTENGARLVDVQGQPLTEITSADLNAERRAASVREPSRGIRIDDDILELFLRGFTREAIYYGLLLAILAPLVFRHEFEADSAIVTAGIFGVIAYRLYLLYPGYREMVKIKHTSQDAGWLLKKISLSTLSIFFISGLLIGGGFTLASIATSNWLKSSFGGVPYVSVLGIPVYVTMMIFVPLLIAVVYGANVPARLWAKRQMKLRERTDQQ